MKLKLDENIDARLTVLLHDAGHDATTVRDQGLHGSEDLDLFDRCVSEGLALVTRDLDFSNILRYPPEDTPGIIVFLGPDDLFPTVKIRMQTFVEALTSENPAGHLWIVEPRRIRIHEEN